MKGDYSYCFLLCVAAFCSYASSHGISDLALSFKKNVLWTTSTLESAVNHERRVLKNKKEKNSQMFLSCTSYESSNHLHNLLLTKLGEKEFHPVYYGKNADRVCYTFFDKEDYVVNDEIVTTTLVPHALKIDESVEWTIEYARSQAKLPPLVLEIGLGIGVQAKGIKGSDKHSNVAKSILHSANKLQQNEDSVSDHTNNFFWTSDSGRQLIDVNRRSMINDHRSKHLKSLEDISSCNFNDLKVSSLRSHISFMTTTDSYNPDCMRLLAAVASMHEDVSHVNAHTAYASLSTAEIENLSSVDYTIAPPATDQNAYVQTGISYGPTPYSDIGLDGSNYILGMIDTGVDDLSCFLIDYSGTETTRTPRYAYNDPITEVNRRKYL
jgi:hypothetical protein